MIGIIIHIFPQEIDQLEQTLINLKKSSKYFDNNQKFLVEVVLNLNFTKWDESKIDKEFFINKLSNLEDLTKSWAQTDFWVSEKNESLGCTDPRRICSTKYKADAFIWLDVDIVFSDTLLYHMVEGFNLLKELLKRPDVAAAIKKINPSTPTPVDVSAEGMKKKNLARGT